MSQQYILNCEVSNKDPRPRSTINVNGVQIKALWDSGAGRTILSAKLFHRKDFHQPTSTINEPKVNLISATGNDLNVVGTYRLRFKTSSGYIFHSNTLVVDNLSTPLIIGIDTMEREGVILDTKRRTITIKRDDKLLAQTVYELRATKKVTIAPKQEKAISCASTGNRHNTDVLITP